jgi:hypothetical protein
MRKNTKGEPMNKILFSYYRIKSKPIGCIAATGFNKVGWSLCSKKDVFNKRLARTIAIGRSKDAAKAIRAILSTRNPPKGFINLIDEMYERSQRYFKD